MTSYPVGDPAPGPGTAVTPLPVRHRHYRVADA
jgi:hypothetical protein